MDTLYLHRVWWYLDNLNLILDGFLVKDWADEEGNKSDLKNYARKNSIVTLKEKKKYYVTCGMN